VGLKSFKNPKQNPAIPKVNQPLPTFPIPVVNRGGRRRRRRGEVGSAFHWMPKTLRRRELEAVDPILLALKPRQVVLNMNMNMKKPSTDHKPLLLQAVAHFLDRNGFSKTLKKFLSEAQLQVFLFLLDS